MSKIILFTGSGIGVPVGLPTTTDFVSTITKIRDNNPILKYVFEYLGKSSNDIENLLFTLAELNREDNSTFKIIKNVVTEGNLPETVKIMENISSFNSQVRNAIDSIKKEIFNKLNTFNRIKAFSLY